MAGFNCEMQDRVLTIQLQNPPLNTLTIATMDGIAKALTDHGPKAQVVVVTSGVEGIFSFGVDPASVLATDIPGRTEIFKSLGRMVRSFLIQGRPILTEISGAAMAGGAVLGGLGDYSVIHSANGKICFSEAKVGLPLPNFVQELILRRCGGQNFFQIGVLARNLAPEQAVEVGLADAVYSSDAEGTELLTAMIGKIKRLHPEVLKKTSLDYRRQLIQQIDDFLADSGEFSHFLSDDFLGAGLKALSQ